MNRLSFRAALAAFALFCLAGCGRGAEAVADRQPSTEDIQLKKPKSDPSTSGGDAGSEVEVNEEIETDDLANRQWHVEFDQLVARGIERLEKQTISRNRSGAETVNRTGVDLGEVFLTSANGIKAAREFCPTYAQLSNAERLHFWAKLFQSISHSETLWNRYSRYTESGMSDPVTGRTTVSEGLLQLSYSDRLYFGCDGISWNSDRSLPATSPQKTIFDPQANLECGVRVLGAQIHARGTIRDSRSYWAVLRTTTAGYKRLRMIWNKLVDQGELKACGSRKL